MSKGLSVAINAQFHPGPGTGGVETAVRELVHALGKLSEIDDGAEEYLIVGPWSDPEWLSPFLAGRQRIVRGAPPEEPPRKNLLQYASGPLLTAYHKVQAACTSATPSPPFVDWLGVPGGSTFFNGLGCDMVHFPFQPFVPCNAPTVYNPHDLQHLHFPQFFLPAEIKRREAIYRAGCRRSHTVVVASNWTRNDVVERYQVPLDKVQIIPWAPPAQRSLDLSSAAVAAVRTKYDLTESFALYPAATWEHKNHLRLLEAVALLRQRAQLNVEIICTGVITSHFDRIKTRRKALGMEREVRFIGHVPGADLSALYRAAQFVFIPTLFEAASAPLFEAWQHDTPAACSSVTSLPEQAAGAGLLFDPLSVEEMAAALARMTSESTLRETLRLRGQRRLNDFSFERTARAYRAVYRRAARRELSEEDRSILSRDWMWESAKVNEAKPNE